MEITLRTKGGWTAKVENTNTAFCDHCHAVLFEAPHGGIYCDNAHDMQAINPLSK